MKRIKLTIATTTGDSTIDAYLPFAEALFAVHNLGDVWGITHVPSGYRVPRAYGDTRGGALVLAGKLHRACPSAAKVGRGGAPAEGNLRVRGSGPHKALAAEVMSVLGIAA
jgi:hypothetical protein